MSDSFEPEIVTKADGTHVYSEITYTGEVLDAMARELGKRLDAELFARLAMQRGFYPADVDVARENAELRELAHLVAEYVSADQCEGCVTKRACNAGELDMCWIRKAILEKLRELGMEVDG